MSSVFAYLLCKRRYILTLCHPIAHSKRFFWWFKILFIQMTLFRRRKWHTRFYRLFFSTTKSSFSAKKNDNYQVLARRRWSKESRIFAFLPCQPLTQKRTCQGTSVKLRSILQMQIFNDPLPKNIKLRLALAIITILHVLPPFMRPKKIKQPPSNGLQSDAATTKFFGR